MMGGNYAHLSQARALSQASHNIRQGMQAGDVRNTDSRWSVDRVVEVAANIVTPFNNFMYKYGTVPLDNIVQNAIDPIGGFNAAISANNPGPEGIDPRWDGPLNMTSSAIGTAAGFVGYATGIRAGANLVAPLVTRGVDFAANVTKSATQRLLTFRWGAKPNPIVTTDAVPLSNAQNAAVRRINNISQNNAKPGDFTGVRNEKAGISTGYDHITEMRQSVDGLNKSITSIENSLNNPTLNPQVQNVLNSELSRARTLLQRMEDTLNSGPSNTPNPRR